MVRPYGGSPETPIAGGGAAARTAVAAGLFVAEGPLAGMHRRATHDLGGDVSGFLHRFHLLSCGRRHLPPVPA
ncbi:hypothetical protein [Geotalea uraniireducens]|uniref:hypothetical protein n=1 Tax=Geotalea uraniireducens TaxID=351604 RepID=UPI0024937E21|nr:hypothetical protein [Geotalea uraniireducens]